MYPRLLKSEKTYSHIQLILELVFHLENEVTKKVMQQLLLPGAIESRKFSIKLRKWLLFYGTPERLNEKSRNSRFVSTFQIIFNLNLKPI